MSGNLPEELNKRSDRAKLREQLEAAKQREVTLIEREAGWAKTLELAAIQVEALTLERDAARNSWQLLHDYAKSEVKDWEGRNADRFWQSNRFLQTMENWLLTSTAALAERDRAIERKTAERCAEIAHGIYPAGWCREKILREFGLDPKPEVA